MIEPRPWAVMTGAARLLETRTPVRLTATMSSQRSGGISASGPPT